MKKWFYAGALTLVGLEVLRVYFIMPMPGSQQYDTLGIAYFLHRTRWLARCLTALAMTAGARASWRGSRVLTTLAALLTAGVVYVVNAEMSADRMFLQPTQVVMATAAESQVDLDRIVVGVERDGEARAYPIQLIGYHHQVRDQLGGRPIIATYCTVCRTGRVFEPIVAGQVDDLRLVGMDHFNAMFEDASTGTWWRQANGEAVIGPLAGALLPEVPSNQLTLRRWLALHPASLVMQADPAFADAYAQMSGYEGGKGGSLTGRALDAWAEKAWVVGVSIGDDSCAYDWGALTVQRVVRDVVGGVPIAVVLAADNSSFVAFQVPTSETTVVIQGDALVVAEVPYSFAGTAGDGRSPALTPVPASQEFWHSWRTFHPGTRRF